MKKIYLILAAVAALMALSCQKQSVIENNDDAITAPRYVKCVIVDNPDTKVSLNASTGKTEWVAGDEVLVHGQGSSNRKTVTLAAGDISADGKVATIDVSGIEPYDRSTASPWYESQLYISYPASLVPAGNMYYNSIFSGDLNTFLLAGCDNATHDVMYVYNMCGAMTFAVSGDYDSYTLVGNGGENVGYSMLVSRIAKVLSGHGDWDIRLTNNANPFFNTPVTSVSGTLVADGTTPNYVYFPAGVNLTGGYTLYLKKSGAIVDYVKTTKSVVITPGQLLPLGLIPAGKIHGYVAPTSHDATHPAIAGADNLSATASANCYVVDASNPANSGKVFKFKAVKGNSETSVGTINSVSIVWETYNNNTTPTANSVIKDADFDFQDGDPYGWITFEMPASVHAGNALIAAKDNSDNILWSWHIWVPSTAYSNDSYGGVHKTNIMSRNLGALDDISAGTTEVIAVENIGLMYQWGRKDPFMGPSVNDDNWPSFAKLAGTAISTHAGQISLAESIEQPTVFVTNNGDWCSDHSSAYWGDGSTKSQYDPCPPSYRVPNREQSYPLWVKEAGDWTGVYNGTYQFFTIGSTAVFPLSGYISYSDGTFYGVKTDSYFWNSHADGDDLAYNRRVYATGVSRYSAQKSYGFGVRCVLE